MVEDDELGGWLGVLILPKRAAETSIANIFVRGLCVKREKRGYVISYLASLMSQNESE